MSLGIFSSLPQLLRSLQEVIRDREGLQREADPSYSSFSTSVRACKNHMHTSTYKYEMAKSTAAYGTISRDEVNIS